MWEIVEYLKKEGRVVKDAPLAFIVLAAIGFFGGLSWRSEQVTTYQDRIVARDETIHDLKEDLAKLQSKPEAQIQDSETASGASSTGEVALSESGKPSEPILTADQISKLEFVLKANPSNARIQKGGKTPKKLATQIQGAFNSSGWKIDSRETIDTQDWLYVEVQGRRDAETLIEAFDSSGVRYHSSESSDGSFTVFVNTENQ